MRFRTTDMISCQKTSHSEFDLALEKKKLHSLITLLERECHCWETIPNSWDSLRSPWTASLPKVLIPAGCVQCPQKLLCPPLLMLLPKSFTMWQTSCQKAAKQIPDQPYSHVCATCNWDDRSWWSVTSGGQIYLVFRRVLSCLSSSAVG